MKKIFFVSLIVLLACCQMEQYNSVVKGSVKGLKKGMLYLQKNVDTTWANIDSAAVYGDSHFEIHFQLNEPQVLYLILDKDGGKKEGLRFFAANSGTTEINTSLESFAFNASIEGSKQQELLAEYEEMNRAFNNKSLDLIQAKFEAPKNQELKKLDSLQRLSDHYQKSRIRYSVNFCIHHNNSEVSPYIALTELYQASTKMLDTLYEKLTPKIKESKYGMELEKYISEIKKGETNE